jgi:hypothetical protein
LHKAARRGNVEGVKNALAEGINLHQCNKNGKTALHCAVLYNKDEEAAREIVQLLLEAKSKVCTPDMNGKSALDYDSSERVQEVLRSHLKREALYVEDDAEEPAEQRVKNNTQSSLHQDAAKGNAAQVTLLLKQKADVNQRDENGETPLHYAARCKDDGSACAIALLLLTAGAKPCAKDKKGRTPDGCGSWAVKSVISQHLDKQREAARAAAQLQEASEAMQEPQTPRGRLARWRSALSFSRSKSAPSSRKGTPSHSQKNSPESSFSRSLAPLSPRKGELFPFGVEFDDEKDSV